MAQKKGFRHSEKTKQKISETKTKIPKIILICKQCNLTFKVWPSQSNKKYCCRECYKISTKETRKGLIYKKEPNEKRICLQCNSTFEVRPYYNKNVVVKNVIVNL